MYAPYILQYQKITVLDNTRCAYCMYRIRKNYFRRKLRFFLCFILSYQIKTIYLLFKKKLYIGNMILLCQLFYKLN